MSFLSSVVSTLSSIVPGGGGQQESVDDMVKSFNKSDGYDPTQQPAPGMEWKDNHWQRRPNSDGRETRQVTDYCEPEGPQAPWVEQHDHSSGNPSSWSVAQWKAALKADPEKYTRLYQELATTDHGLSADVMEHKAEMGAVVSTALQDFNRDMTLLKSINDANHETLKALAQFRV